MTDFSPRAEQLPELADALRVANILSVPRHQVARLSAEDSFPEAVARLGEMPLWPAAAVRRWGRTRLDARVRRPYHDLPPEDLLDDAASYPIGTTLETTQDGRVRAITVRRRR